MLNVAERFARDHLELQTALEPPSVTRIMIVGTMIEWLKDWARSTKQDVHALYLASRDPRVPWYAKAMGLLVAGYALSPIDLIPDFIPVLGYLDDLILVPLGILLAIQLIPAAIMAEHRRSAVAAQARPRSRVAAATIVGIWIASVTICGLLVFYHFQ